MTEKSGELVKKIEKTARDAVGKNAIALIQCALHRTRLVPELVTSNIVSTSNENKTLDKRRRKINILQIVCSF